MFFFVTGLDDSLDEVPDSQILTEDCESVMEVECGDGEEEDGVETKTEVKLGGNVLRVMIVRHLLPYSPPSPSPFLSNPHRKHLVLMSQTPRML